MITQETADKLAGTDTKVIYRAYRGAPAEEGVVIRTTRGGAFVRYGGDATPKLTMLVNLATLDGRS